MNDKKMSRFLSEVVEYSKTIGEKKDPPFTAERFVVAIIDKIDQTPDEDKCHELKMIETVLKVLIPDLGAAKSELLEYIVGKSSTVFMDDLYMKKKLQAAGDRDDHQEITADLLLITIAKDPSVALKRVMPKAQQEPNSPPDPIQKPAAEPKKVQTEEPVVEKEVEPAPPIAETEAEPEIIEEPGASKVSTLVSQTKKIREVLSTAVYGQDHAIETFATGYFQAGMLAMADKSRKRPKATFLFAGPPGVGKTFLAENVAEALKLPFKRFDMSEFTDSLTAVQEFCGYPRSYKNFKKGQVTGFVDQNPQCVLLFDEIEKAYIEVIHLFLQMLDAGRLKDAMMEKEISFKDTIIILTTNAGKQLYEDSDTQDMSTISRNVVIDALRNDRDVHTGAPFFPSAICSRFAAGNVVMFNHLDASFLRTIAKKEIQRHAADLTEETGIQVQVEEDVYSVLLFAEGASVDARTIRGRAEAFFNSELYELFRLIASDKVKTGVDDIKKIRIGVDLTKAKEDVSSLFQQGSAPKILVFAQEPTVALCRQKLSGFEIMDACATEQAIEILKNNDIGFAMMDMTCGAAEMPLARLNLEDVDSAARDLYRFIRESRSALPVYLIDGSEVPLAEEEKVSFKRQGARGVLRVSEQDNLKTAVDGIADVLYQQENMARLARANKLVAFESMQFVSEDGTEAEIKLFDLRMKVAVDPEDSKNILSAVSRPDVSFSDVIGAGDAKKELAYFVEYLKNPKKYTGTGVKSPRGVILYGPPGTGKTMLAKAMAKESGVTFIAAEGNQFRKMYVGQGSEKVHEVFKAARKYAPSILFVDEIDAIAMARQGSDHDSGSTEVEATLTAFLAEMDGFSNDTSKPVFVLAATNFDVTPGSAKSLDPALMRRFDRRVYIGLPGKEDRIRFMRMKIQKNCAFEISDEEIDSLAMRSTGMSLAEMDSAMELALRSAIREGDAKVTDAIMEEAFETFNNGETKKWDVSQLERVARHESGHAFMSWYSGSTPSYLTIVARGEHGGYMQHADNEDKAIYTKEELLFRIRTSLGGRAAEIVYYGDQDGISTGASGDLATATNIARQMVCSYGMDDDFGISVISGASAGAMSVEVREAVNKILKEQMAETIKIICANKEKVDALVEALMVKNHMNGNEIDTVLTGAGGNGAVQA